jgi:hypothetical protein
VRGGVLRDRVWLGHDSLDAVHDLSRHSDTRHLEVEGERLVSRSDPARRSGHGRATVEGDEVARLVGQAGEVALGV